jgi:hypothetical protein
MEHLVPLEEQKSKNGESREPSLNSERSIKDQFWIVEKTTKNAKKWSGIFLTKNETEKEKMETEKSLCLPF